MCYMYSCSITIVCTYLHLGFLLACLNVIASLSVKMAVVREFILDHVAEIVFFLFKIGESMLEPTVRLYLYQGVCLRYYGNDTSCSNLSSYPEREDLIQVAASNYIIAYKFLMNFPAIVLGFFCGAWSDAIGRKIPVLLTLMASVLAGILYLFSMATSETEGPIIALVLLGAAVRGGFGRSAVITMALYSYVCDQSVCEKRTQNIGRLLSMNYFGYFFGSLGAGAILELYGFDVVFILVTIINIICIAIVIVFMKSKDGQKVTEDAATPSSSPQASLPPAAQLTKSKMPFRLANAKDSVQVLTRPRHHRSRLHILLLFATIFVQQTCKSGELDATLLFTEAAPLSWRKSMYGYLLATDYALLGAATLLLLPLLIRLFHLHDVHLLLIGVVFRVIRLLIIAFSRSTFEVYLSVIIGCPSALIISSAKALISKTVSDDEMGKAFSLLSCAETVSILVGSVIFTTVYNSTKYIMPGFVFAIEGLFFFLFFFVLMLLGRDMKLAAQYNILSEVSGGGPSAAYGTTGNPSEPMSPVTQIPFGSKVSVDQKNGEMIGAPESIQLSELRQRQDQARNASRPDHRPDTVVYQNDLRTGTYLNK